jgi:ABC-type dipeptide/oligopeptide/nickel transport system ATPase component
MIVGKTGSGKSVSWLTLQQVLSTMKKEGVAGYNLVKVRTSFLLQIMLPF